MEPHDAVPGRAMDALESRPRRRDQGVCIFGWFPPTSEAPGWDEPGRDALGSLFRSGILGALESPFCRQLTLRSKEEVRK